MYIDKKFTAWFRYYFPSDLKTPEFTSEKEVYDFNALKIDRIVVDKVIK